MTPKIIIKAWQERLMDLRFQIAVMELENEHEQAHAASIAADVLAACLNTLEKSEGGEI